MPAWLWETPYTTIHVFPTVTVTVTFQYPARAGIPLCRGGLNPHTPVSSTRCVRSAETGSQSTLYESQVNRTASRAPNRHPIFQNNTTHLVRSIITYIFQIPGIPSDELHTTTLSHKHYRSALFKNTSQTKSFHLSPQDTATSPAAVSRNDTRLPGNLNPPTVAHNTLNTDPRALWSITNRQHCPIVTHLIRYYWLSKYKYI